MRIARRAVSHLGVRSDILVLLIHQNSVLTFCPLPVVQPPCRILCFAVEITRGKVVTRSKLTEEARTQGVDDKVATIEVAMRLVFLELTPFHCHVQCVDIGPGTPHRCPLIPIETEAMIEWHTIPKGAGDGWVIPEHTPRFRRVNLVALEQRILRDIVL